MRKIVTIIISALLAVVMALGLVACGGGGGLTIYNGDENVTGKTVNLYLGDSMSLSLKNGNKSVSSSMWLSDEPSVAEIDNTGKVKGVSEGSAKISVKYQDGTKFLEASCTVNVTPDTSKKFDLKSKATDIADEGVMTLSFYENQAKLAGAIQGLYDFEQMLDYDVSASGVLSFSKVESATATMSPSVASGDWGTILPHEMTIENIEATVAGPYITITAQTDSWDEGGGKDEISLGTYELTAAQAELLGVNIEGAIPVTGVTLNKTEITLDINEEYVLTATVLPENATMKGHAYSSSDSEKVSVDAATGKIKGVAKTDAPITITVTTTDGSKTAECKVTVTDKTAKAFASNSNGAAITDTRIKFYEDGKVALVGTHFGIDVGLESTYTYDDNTLAIAAVDDKNVGSTEEPLVFDIAFAVTAVTGDDSKLEVTVNATPAEGETQVWGKFVISKSAFALQITYTNTSESVKGEYIDGENKVHSLQIANDGTVTLKSDTSTIIGKATVKSGMITGITATVEIDDAATTIKTTTTFIVTEDGDNIVIAPNISGTIAGIIPFSYDEGPYTFAKSAITALNLQDYAPSESQKTQLLQLTATTDPDKNVLKFYSDGSVDVKYNSVDATPTKYTVATGVLTIQQTTATVDLSIFGAGVISYTITFAWDSATNKITMTVTGGDAPATAEFTLTDEDLAKLTSVS